MNASCSYCGLQMNPGVACTHAVYTDLPDGPYDRIPNGDEPCHDCNTPAGGLHHPGCDSERCPRCEGQAIACDCVDSDPIDDEDDE